MLGLLNRALAADPTANFCTVFFARVHRVGGRLVCRYANGGHVPPLILRRDGSVEEVDGARVRSQARSETRSFGSQRCGSSPVTCC